MSGRHRSPLASRPRRLALGVLLALVARAGAAAGQDATPLATLDVEFLAADSGSCRDALGEFRWLCGQFDAPSWQRVFGQSFWARGSLSGARADLDADGRGDLMLRVGHAGWCGGAGCANFFLFGDQPPGRGIHLFSIRSLETRLFIDEAAGVRRLRFGRDGTPTAVEDIRRRTLSSRRGDLAG